MVEKTKKKVAKLATVSVTVSAQFVDRAEAQKALKALVAVLEKLPNKSSVTVITSNLNILG